MKDIYQLLNEFAGLTRKEADDKFVIEEEQRSWTVKAREYIELATFKALIGLTREYGGDYFREKGRACFRIPKPEPTSTGVAPELLNMENKKNETADYSLARSLRSPLKQLVPCLADAEGKIFDGFHRKKVNPNAWTVKLDHIKTPVDRALARMAVNFCRRHYTSEEMREDIGLLVGFGYSVKQISDMTGISERTIYRYMPEKLKKPEPEQLAKARLKKTDIVPAGTESEVVRKELTAVTSYPKTQETTQLETPTFQAIQAQIMAQISECEGCGKRVHRTRLKLVGGKLLCPKCRGEKPVKLQPKARVIKSTDKWEHRAARMKPQHSQMEIAVLEKLKALNTPVEIDRSFCLQSTTPDFYLPKHNVAVYLDGSVHKGREDRDEALRELLAKRHGVKVISISYDKFSESEVKRVLNEIKVAVEGAC